MKKLIPVTALVVMILSACTKDKGGMPAPVTGFTCSGTAKTHIVQMKDDFFEPATLDACVGDTIKWILAGTNPHTTTSTTIPAGASTWNAQMSSTTITTFTHVIDTVGTFDYECSYHAPGMSGKIIAH